MLDAGQGVHKWAAPNELARFEAEHLAQEHAAAPAGPARGGAAVRIMIVRGAKSSPVVRPESL